MSKTLAEVPITTRNARSKLDTGVHWRGIDVGVHLGYRKARRAGAWLVRWYVGAGKYRQAPLRAADDVADADGGDVLNFDQAKAAAIRLVAEKRADAVAASAGPVPTVRTAIDTYLAARDMREASSVAGGWKGDAHRRLALHVLSDRELAERPLHALSEANLENWRLKVEAGRAPATIRRITNDFKAALNAAGIRHRARLPVGFPAIVKNGLATRVAVAPKARDDQALSDDMVRRIIKAALEIDAENGWEGDLYRMVLLLAATGARFSQIARMTVGNVQVERKRLMVPASRKGRGVKRSSHIPVPVQADVIGAITPVISRRRGAEPLLERWRHKQVASKDDMPPRLIRVSRGPWRSSPELTRPWLEIVDRAGVPRDVVPYSLRHSSIVRLLRKGLPTRLVAALHDTSTAMIEAHYSAAIVDALDGLAAEAAISFLESAA